MKLLRALQHFFSDEFRVRRVFPKASLDALESEIKRSETTHHAEIRFVIEGGLPWAMAWQGVSARERAEQLFGELGVWDTEGDVGVLIYVLLVERRIEIVADRGIARRVPQSQWQEITQAMAAAFRQGAFVDGAMSALRAVDGLVAAHFSVQGQNNPNQLPNRPVVM